MSELSEKLYKAAGSGNLTEVQNLLKEGADVNAKTGNGETALHSAAISGKQDVAELLLANGADVNALNGSGETPLERAVYYIREYSNKETLEVLRRHGGVLKGSYENYGEYESYRLSAADKAPGVKQADSIISKWIFCGGIALFASPLCTALIYTFLSIGFHYQFSDYAMMNVAGVIFAMLSIAIYPCLSRPATHKWCGYAALAVFGSAISTNLICFVSFYSISWNTALNINGIIFLLLCGTIVAVSRNERWRGQIKKFMRQR